MTFEEYCQNKTVSTLEPSQTFDPTRHIAPNVAHELNNILTIVQGYADRLLLRNATNANLMPDLKLISEAARRAATVIRNAKPPSSNAPYRSGAHSSQVVG